MMRKERVMKRMTNKMMMTEPRTLKEGVIEQLDDVGLHYPFEKLIAQLHAEHPKATDEEIADAIVEGVLRWNEHRRELRAFKRGGPMPH